MLGFKSGCRAAGLVASLALAACGGPNDGSGGNSDAVPSGRLSAAITDAAVDDLVAVNLRLTALQLRRQGAEHGDLVVVDLRDGNGEALEVNLLEFQNGQIFTLFEDQRVPAGVYEHARLVLEAPARTPRECVGQDPLQGSHVIEATGGRLPIFVPSGANNGIKLVSPFRVPENGAASIVIDFDLRAALHRPPPFDCYFLRPTFRVLMAGHMGAIAGTVAASLLDGSNGLCSDNDPQTGNAVYVYAGADQVPGDLDGVDDGTADPYATARVTFDSDAGQGRYFLGFIPPGEYTIAFTCKADLERIPDPDSQDMDLHEADDELDFQQPGNVTVDAGTPVSVNFAEQLS